MDRTLRVALGAVRRRINNLPPFQDGTFFGVNICRIAARVEGRQGRGNWPKPAFPVLSKGAQMGLKP